MRKIAVIILAWLLALPPCAFSVTAQSQWDVRTGGNDANGGCFDPTVSSPGTNRAIADAAFVTFDGSTITATTSGTSATITITGYTVVAADKGNCLHITGGPNFMAGWYTITGVSTGANTWTLDTNVSSGAGSAMTGNMGGGLATIGQATTNHIAGNSVFIQNTGTAYTTSSGFSFTAGNNYIAGYTSSHGDGGRPTLQISSGSGVNLLALSQAGTGGMFVVQDIILDCNSKTTSVGSIQQSTGGAQVQFARVKITNCTSYAVRTTQNIGWWLEQVEATGNSGNGVISQSNGTFIISNSYFHGNTAVVVDANCCGIDAIRNIIANNTGASTDGIRVGFGGIITDNIFYKNGRDGIRTAGLNGSLIRGNIAVLNSGQGFHYTGSNNTLQAGLHIDSNAAYGNSPDGLGFSGSFGGYTMSQNITLTADPFTNGTSGDFSLAGAQGALLKGTLAPTTFPGTSNTNAHDFGAIQSSGGGGAKAYIWVQ